MLGQLIFEGVLPLEQEAVVTNVRAMTWSDLRDQARDLRQTFRALGKRRVGLVFDSRPHSYAALAALDYLGSDVFLFSALLSSEEARRIAQKLQLGALVFPARLEESGLYQVHELAKEDPWSGQSSITILTSGSTGEPKAARHSWESLSRPVRRRDSDLAPRWLLTYRPNLYAGLQVMLQCFADRGTLVTTEGDLDPQAIADFMRASRVEFVSATPSYWRRLILFADHTVLKAVPLRQITLGGEVIDQIILDKLRECFPSARLLHIYATTELGRCFAVNDGLAGFPASYLGKPLPDGVELRISDNELFIRSPNSMQMYDPHSSQKFVGGGWFATGDIVEIRGNRVCFAGRNSEMINVAGSKVYPVEVERVIRSIPGVMDVRVFGKSSSIAGELVVCEIVPSSGQSAQELKDTVAKVCRAQLSTYQQPRMIKIVERIDLSTAGKTLRTKTS